MASLADARSLHYFIKYSSRWDGMSNYGEVVGEQANLTGQDGVTTMEGKKEEEGAFSVFLQLQRIEPVGAIKGVLKTTNNRKILA